MELVNKEDNELYVRTPAGDVKITNSPSVPPDEVHIKLDPARPEVVTLHHEGGGQWRASSETLHKCALCGVAVAGGQHSLRLIDRLLADHRAVCEKRPVEIGDYVRWENKQAGRWAEGGVVQIAGDLFWISVDRCTAGWTPLAAREDGARPFGVRYAADVRHIPHPGSGDVPRGTVTTHCQHVGGDGKQCTATTTERVPLHWDCPTHARPGAGGQRSAFAGTRPGATTVGTAQAIQREIGVQRFGGQHDPAPPRCAEQCESCCIPGATAATGLCMHGKAYRTAVRETAPSRCACGENCTPPALPPADVLVDGLTVAECDSRWSDNRYRLEAGLPQRYALTPAQVAAGRAAWQARNHPIVSALVRDRVAAGLEAERNRVRVEVQDVD
jgi:hypothetical protein